MVGQCKLRFLVVVLWGLLVVSTAIADWEAIDGPPVGIGEDICVCLTSGTEYIYLASGSGEFPYKSVNHGSSWDPMNTHPDAEDARCLSADPTDRLIIYIGKDGGVFKSTNGGMSFTEVGQDSITNDDVIDLEMDPSSSDTVWCVSQWAQGEDVLFRTDNAGNSWVSSHRPIP